MLPRGQRTRADFPRFGLLQYANRFPKSLDNLAISIEIDGSKRFDVCNALADLPRTTVVADFHCVTTWTYRNAKWEGVRFSDFFNKHIASHIDESAHLTAAVFTAKDGYKTSLLLKDLLSENVLLADSFDEQKLTIEHGAPLRLVAPDHYGYKNLKHLRKIEFFSTTPVVKTGIAAVLDHPRARVSHEERGQWIPGWVLRYLFRPLIARTERAFRSAMNKKRIKGS